MSTMGSSTESHDLSVNVFEQPHLFLQPPPALHAQLLQLTKQFLDPLANDVTEAQLERQKNERRSRKRKRGDAREQETELLRMKKLYVDGFDVDQVWQQASKVLGAAAQEVERALPDDGESDELEDGVEDPEEERIKTVRFDEDGFEVDEDGDEDGVDMEDEGDELDEELDDEDAEEPLSGDDESLDIGHETPPSEVSEDEDAGEVLVKDRHGLNDGFFSIDDFNKQTQFLEAQDARGDPDDGAASDEEDIDWAADPTTLDPRAGKIAVGDEDDEDLVDGEDDAEDEDEEGGPTFGDMDLDAPEGESDEDDGEDDEGVLVGPGDMGNTNEVLYADFFAPPAQAASKKKKKRQPTKKYEDRAARKVVDPATAADGNEEEDEDLKRTVSGVHRDLFEDDLSEPEEVTVDTPGTSKSANLSTHERAQLALRAEIRRLEAANVSAKPWSLTGESIAPARPVNSLLEEDLDFERAGKPVPVITEEVSESIEDLIKRRILAREFDEVIRRRPNDLVTGSDPRRGRVREELADTKPKQGLAEEYEQDHLRQTDPNFMDTRTEALKATHKQIEAQWASVSAQLDALSNWHYKPRAPAPTLDVRVDAPTISLEDARPATGGEVVGASLLAPQEIYKPGEEGKREGEVLTRGGTAIAKEEETREAKRRRRAREKERAKKAGGNVVDGATTAGGKAAPKGKKAEKNEVAAQLKKGGAKIIDSKGAVRDVEGNAVREAGGPKGAGSFKL